MNPPIHHPALTSGAAAVPHLRRSREGGNPIPGKVRRHYPGSSLSCAILDSCHPPYTPAPRVPVAALLRICRAPAGFVMHRRCSPVRETGIPTYDAQQNAAICNRFQRSPHRYPNPATVAGGLDSGLRRNDDVSW